MLDRVSLVNPFLMLSPEFMRPTTRPYPTSWLSRIPPIEAMSLIRAAPAAEGSSSAAIRTIETPVKIPLCMRFQVHLPPHRQFLILAIPCLWPLLVSLRLFYLYPLPFTLYPASLRKATPSPESECPSPAASCRPQRPCRRRRSAHRRCTGSRSGYPS